MLLLVYSGLFGVMYGLERKRPHPTGHLDVSNTAALVAVVMAATAFAVSNLNFLNGEVTMSVFYIRTLVDFCGVLILTVEHEQLREEALHKELTAMDGVLHRQYEQYKRSKEGIKLINRRYHELKVQIADIRAERDRAKQDAASTSAAARRRKKRVWPGWSPAFCSMRPRTRPATRCWIPY